ncbi:MAG TPA: helix-turn-helix domain-containing protein [Solirubrobacteraceae bacterium]|nr:helix-turn-helix domain-containing protein [Solirubrobacteraceae bacterium]
MTRRRYELKERARRQEETRRRIVEATVALHREVGPAKTTVADVARRAGVTRVTVYNHFPDDVSLFGACSAHFVASHPPPDPASWAAVEHPGRRLRVALAEQYAWFAENEAMVGNVSRDVALLPALAEAIGSSEAARHEAAMRDVLLAGRGLRGARRDRARAAIGLALAFPTWQQLVRREGLGDQAAIELMARAVEAA